MTETHGHSEWESALDDMERATAIAEKLLLTLRVDEIEPWVLPHLSGPIPLYLVERAQALSERQERVAETIPSVLARLSRQRTLADRIGQLTTQPRRPVYIDASA
jgi:hypothetical protein